MPELPQRPRINDVAGDGLGIEIGKLSDFGRLRGRIHSREEIGRLAMAPDRQGDGRMADIQAIDEPQLDPLAQPDAHRIGQSPSAGRHARRGAGRADRDAVHVHPRRRHADQ